MHTTIKEGVLEFEFSDDWQIVLKWDDSSAYRNGIATLDCSKAMDLLASSTNHGKILLIEVKDFRGFRIQNKPRISTGELFDEVGRKVRDTIAGIRGAARTGDDAKVQEFAAEVASLRPVIVVLWMEEDVDAAVGNRRQRRKTRLGTMTQQLKKRVRWLTSRAIVRSRSTAGRYDDGITVRSLTRPS